MFYSIFSSNTGDLYDDRVLCHVFPGSRRSAAGDIVAPGQEVASVRDDALEENKYMLTEVMTIVRHRLWGNRQCARP